MRRLRSVLLLCVGLWGAGCSLFDPRDPEPPLSQAGTFVQPDTPEQVIANMQAAVAELNTLTYRRSFADELTFEPTASASAASAAIWSSWGQAEEERYFSTLAAAAQFNDGHELSLNDATLTLIDDTEVRYDATYVLTVRHRRPDVPTTVQGLLAWELRQGPDGLWRIAAWTDQELEGVPSWSTLKIGFIQ